MLNSMLLWTLLVVTLSVASAQFFSHQATAPSLSFAIQPPPFVAPSAPVSFEQPVKRDYSHRAVVVNSEHEALLPPQLLNPFYKNPRIVQALAKESWFTPGEMLVTDREAEKIPRQKIYSVLKNAGLVRRR